MMNGRTRKKVDRRGVLAEGEATGHAHRVTVEVCERADGLREFDGATTVSHEEHHAIPLRADQWISGRVREYDHFADMEREVRD